MKHSWILLPLVTALLVLISAEASSFAGNLKDSKIEIMYETSSKSMNTNIPLDANSYFQRTIPTFKDFAGRVFQWRKPYLMKNQSTWAPLTFGIRTVTATVLTVAAASLSSVGGIGGGGLFVPILTLVLDFESRTAAALSAFMILGGSFASVIFCVPQRHPTIDHKPLIDYDTALLLQPNILLGVSLGVIFNVMFPEWFITSLLTTFLSFIAFASCKNAVKYWQAETFLYHSDRERRTIKNTVNGCILKEETPTENGFGNPSESIVTVATSPNIDAHDEICKDGIVQVSSSIPFQDGGQGLREPLLNAKRPQYSFVPLKELAVLMLVWILFYSVYILRGSKDGESCLHIPICGLVYWLISGLQIPLDFAVTIWMIYLHRNSNEKDSDQQVASKAATGGTMLMFPAISLLAGVLGGMLGVGSGMLLNIFLLQTGMPPQVTAATCAFMVFFSSAMSVAQYLLLGLAPLEYALYFSIICFISASFGVVIIQRAITRLGRLSLIIFSVSTVLGLSTILMTYFGVLKVWSQYKNGDYMGFSAPC